MDPKIREAIRCGEDPYHFISTHCCSVDPVKGLVPFIPYEFQKELINSFKTNRFNILLKARQIGATTLSSLWALHLAIFHQNKNILIVATNQSTAMGIIDKVKIAIQNMPQ